jgi:hypothetical protein
VTRQPFMFTDFEVLAAPLLRQVAPEVINYEEDVEFRVAFFSGSGAVKGPLVAIAPSLGAGNKSASGCDPGDFLGIGAGSVALIQRGVVHVRGEDRQRGGGRGGGGGDL